MYYRRRFAIDGPEMYLRLGWTISSLWQIVSIEEKEVLAIAGKDAFWLLLATNFRLLRTCEDQSRQTAYSKLFLESPGL